MKHYDILRVVAKLLGPPILLFALYVQFHGDYGPGGGFQAGVIFAVGFVLYALIYGIEATMKVLPVWVLRVCIAGGVIIFTGVGYVSLLLGGRFLDYSVLRDSPVAGQHLGILLVELGVGITVFAAMVTIFYAFAGRGTGE